MFRDDILLDDSLYQWWVHWQVAWRTEPYKLDVPRLIHGLPRALIAALLLAYYCLIGAVHPGPKDGHSHGRRPASPRRVHSSRDKVVRGLDAVQSTEVDRRCSFIRHVGEDLIIPEMLRLEAEAPLTRRRRLVGFRRRFKHTDRLKQKVAERLRLNPSLTPTDGLHDIPDAIRFTLQYPDIEYAAGVREDVERLRYRGFSLVELRNTWANDQYKGINSRWREPRSGVLFEVQFHTEASLWARELTHRAYERIRIHNVQGRELAKLQAFQSDVNSRIPIPSGVVDVDWKYGLL